MSQRWNLTLLQRWYLTLSQHWNLTLLQRWYLTLIQLSNPTIIQRWSNVGSWRWSNVDPTLCAHWELDLMLILDNFLCELNSHTIIWPFRLNITFGWLQKLNPGYEICIISYQVNLSSDWLIGCGCLDRQVAHIVFDGAPRVLWATIYLLPELRVEQYWYMVKSPRVVTARVFFVLGRFFYFHPQCQGRRHLHFTWYASHEGHTP